MNEIESGSEIKNPEDVINNILIFLSDIFKLSTIYSSNFLINKNAINKNIFSENRKLYPYIKRIFYLFNIPDISNLPVREKDYIKKNHIQNVNQIDSLVENTSYWDAEYELMRLGYRMTGKYECNSLNEAERIKDFISSYFLFTKIVKRENNQYDIYYSQKRDALERIIKSDNIIDPQTIKETGKLFGYPVCCSEAYIRDGFQFLPSFPYKWLIRRYKSMGAINPLFNPFIGNLYYFPCTLRCNSTLERLKIINKHLSQTNKEWLLYPIIFFLPDSLSASIIRGSAGNMRFCILEPLAIKDNEIKYNSVFSHRDSEEIEIVKKGNNLKISNGIMRIYNNGKLIHKFIYEANIWYYKKTFDNKFWNIFITALINSIRFRPVSINTASYYEDFIKIKEMINKHLLTLKKLKITIDDIQMEKNTILLKITYNQRRLIFSIQKRNDSKKSLLSGKGYAISLYKMDDSINRRLLTPLSILLLNIIEGD